jgi:hypothetical protein
MSEHYCIQNILDLQNLRTGRMSRMLEKEWDRRWSAHTADSCHFREPIGFSAFQAKTG